MPCEIIHPPWRLSCFVALQPGIKIDIDGFTLVYSNLQVMPQIHNCKTFKCIPFSQRSAASAVCLGVTVQLEGEPSSDSPISG